MKDLSVLYIIYSVNLKFTVETFVGVTKKPYFCSKLYKE